MCNPDDDPILEGPGDDGDKYPDPDARCPSCGDAMPRLGPAVCRACAEGGVCAVCANPYHRSWQCPKVVEVRLEMAEAERLMHAQMVADAARAIRERYEAHPIWQEAA